MPRAVFPEFAGTDNGSRFRAGNAYGELTSHSGAFAGDADAAVVQLDKRSDHRQADSQAAARAREALIGLNEEVEDLGQKLGAIPMPLSATLMSTSESDFSDRQVDAAPLGSVFRGVVQEVGEHLGEPRPVKFEHDRAFGE